MYAFIICIMALKLRLVSDDRDYEDELASQSGDPLWIVVGARKLVSGYCS